MVSRRVVVGAGAAVVVAAAGVRVADRDDDLLRALGARPRPVPDAGDTALLATAATEQSDLVDAVARLADDDPELETADLLAVLREQLDVLGGVPVTARADVVVEAGPAAEVARDLAAAARRREADVLRAVSPDLARVLASLAAGQAQVARTLGRRAGSA